MCRCVGSGIYAMDPPWRSEDNFMESVLFLYLYVGSRDQIQSARLAKYC